MAGAAQHIKTATGPDFSGIGGKIVDGVFAMVYSIPNAIRAAREAEDLLNQSDEELARRGLKREDVAQHVMDRCFHN